MHRSLVEAIEARTGPRGFSAFVDAAAARALALANTREIVEDHVQKFGPFTEEEMAEANRAWRGE